MAKPDSGGWTTARFDGIRAGSAYIRATAHPNGDGTGTAQATGEQAVSVDKDRIVHIRLSMATTVVRLGITPVTVALTPGQTASLAAAPSDADSAVVMIAPGTLRWTTSDADVVTVDANGAATAIAAGAATITAYESESGVSGTVAVTVTASNSPPNPTDSRESDVVQTAVGVNGSEIGAMGLGVGATFTATKADVPTDGTPAFASLAPNSVQLVSVHTQAAQELRGLAVWSGTGQTRLRRAEATPVTVDARSSAESMVFMAPGIMTLDLTEAPRRLDQIRACGSLGRLEDCVRSGLLNGSLADLWRQPDCQALIQQCGQEWRAANVPPELPEPPGDGRSVRVGYGSKTQLFLTVNTDRRDGTPGLCEIGLENQAWRDVVVYRRDYKNGVPVVTTPIRGENGQLVMNGATPLDWGNLFNPLFRRPSEFGNPGKRKDFPDFRDMTASEYWVCGIGTVANSETPPDGIPLLPTIAVVSTLLTYCILPAISFLTSGLGFIKQTREALDFKEILLGKLEPLMGRIEGGAGIGNLTRELLRNDGPSDKIDKAGIEAVLGLVSICVGEDLFQEAIYEILLARGASVGAAALSRSITSILGIAFIAGEFGMAAGNLSMALPRFLSYPIAQKAVVSLTGGSTPVVIK